MRPETQKEYMQRLTALAKHDQEVEGIKQIERVYGVPIAVAKPRVINRMVTPTEYAVGCPYCGAIHESDCRRVPRLVTK